MKLSPTAFVLVSLTGLLVAGCWPDKPSVKGPANAKDESRTQPTVPGRTEPVKPTGDPKSPGTPNVLSDPGSLTAHRASVGKTLLFEVTGSDSGSVYGTGVYTDDSALAAAAVHAGVLAVGQKGVVKVTILPGQDSYSGSTRHGITSSEWGNWQGSFRVEAAR
jgi:LCCL domain